MISKSWITVYVFCISVLPLVANDEEFAVAIDPEENLKFIEMDMALFTGESIVKEKLIVREILELKRSVFLLKALLKRIGISNTVHTCDTDEFTCTNGQCINGTDRCNHQFECTDLSDEENCAFQTICPEGRWRCNDGQCVDSLFRCDGSIQCTDKSDENGCNNNTTSHRSPVARDDKTGSILNRLRNKIHILETENKEKDKTVLSLEHKVKWLEMQLERDTRSKIEINK